ncbi:MAG: porin [Gammaproteobacteria bacterium]|nr:porin [Gammaproteobacteria bacterium]
MPFAAQAETWNIYGWQNHSWEFVDIDGGRSFDRIQSNAGNIGFAASMDAGNDISVNVQCEQFTYYNHFAGGTGWCNRNSKIGLSHPQMGEIMFATWLLPYNEGVAQWVDPFYDAGADSHTSIMGSVGANTIFYNTGDFDMQASNSHHSNRFDGSAEAYDGNGGHNSFEGFPEFNYSALGYDTGFNRRQENIIQYWSPNWNGFVFRFAWTAGIRDESRARNDHEIDPVIRSSSLAYTNGPLWLAVTWQDHEDWTAASISDDDNNPVMESSDAESIRIAGRYIMDMGDGMSVQLSAMWENLEYEFNGVVDVDTAMSAFGYWGFAGSYDLFDSNGMIDKDLTPRAPVKSTDYASKINGKLFNETLMVGTEGRAPPVSLSYTEATDGTRTWEVGSGGDTDVAAPTFTLARQAVTDDPLTTADETAAAVEAAMTGDLALYLQGLSYVADDENDVSGNAVAKAQYEALKAAGMKIIDEEHEVAMGMHETTVANLDDKATNRAQATEDKNVKIERDAWMVSGKIKFGGPVDFRFSYMDADDLEVSCGSACRGDWDETAADAWNVGLFYTMPAGTELRLTYSEVDNDDNGTYGQGISGTGLAGVGVQGGSGGEIEMFAVGIVHWFD